MKCIEARRMVTPFIDKKLTDKETELFLKHVENCSDCMDELDIYFTMYKAIDTLDSGTHHEFDFKKMLEEEIRSAHHGILRRRAVRVIRSMVMFVAELLLIVSVYTGYQMKQGEEMDNLFRKAIHRLQMRTEKIEGIKLRPSEELIREKLERIPGRGNVRDAKTMEIMNEEAVRSAETEQQESNDDK